MDFVAIDFETGDAPAGGVALPWQLGAARVAAGEIVETREFFFRSRERPDAPTFLDQFEEIFDLLSRTRLVAHNAATERTILTRTAPLTRWGPWLDTLKVARERYPRLESYALGDLCARFDCVPAVGSRTWHDALYDAVACAKLALKIALTSA